MSFGLTATGFLPRRLEDVQADLEAALRARLGQNIQLGGESVLGQIVGVMSERYAELWEVVEQAFVSAYLGSAGDAALDDLVALAAIERLAETFSLATLTLGGTPATSIPAGSVSTDPATGVAWTHLTTVVIGGGGTISVQAQPASTGPVRLLNATTLDIATPITGWNTSVAVADAVEGRDVETDASLRKRFVTAMRASAGNSIDGIAALLLRLEGVLEAVVIENEHSVDDADGRPPHSFETVVRGGAEQDIADTIWGGKPAGIETVGTTSTSVVDANGDGHVVKWSRPTDLQIWMIVDYSVEPGFAEDGESQILDAVLDHGSGFSIGDDVIPFQFVQHIEVENLENLSIRVGTAPNPATSTPIVVPRTALASFDSGRISFNRTN